MCSSGWWKYLHWLPLYNSLHWRRREQLETLWSLPARFKQLKHPWFSFTALRRSLGLIAIRLWHWSVQWDEFLHSQHLKFLVFLSSFVPSPPERWLIPRLGDWYGFLSGAVALIRDFISPVIHDSRVAKVASLLVLSKKSAETLRSSKNIFCSTIASIWLLFMSFSWPTSVNVLKLRLTKPSPKSAHLLRHVKAWTGRCPVW